MNPRAFLWLLLMAAVVSCDAAMVAASRHPLAPLSSAGQRGVSVDLLNPTGVALISLAISQITLVALWFGLARRALPWRAAMLFATMVVVGRMLERCGCGSPIALVALLASAALLAAAALRVTGLRMDVCEAQVSQNEQRWRISIGQMLWITTLVSVWLAAAQTVASPDVLLVSASPWKELSVGSALIALATAWGVLAEKHASARTVLLVGAQFCAAALTGDDVLFEILIATSVLSVALGWVARCCGYRTKRAADHMILFQPRLAALPDPASIV